MMLMILVMTMGSKIEDGGGRSSALAGRIEEEVIHDAQATHTRTHAKSAKGDRIFRFRDFQLRIFLSWQFSSSCIAFLADLA